MSSFNRPKQLQKSDKAPPSTVCQKCTLKGHYTYQCKNPRPYVPRLSRSQRLEKDLRIGDTKKKGDGPAIELPDEFRTKKGLADKILAEREAQRMLDEKKNKDKKQRRRSSSSSSSSDSDSDSDSSSGTSDSDSDSSSSSRSDSPPRRKRSTKRRPSSSRSRSPSRTRRPRSPDGGDRRSASPVRRKERRESASPIKRTRDA